MTNTLKLRRASLGLTLFLIAGCGDTSPTAPTSDFITLTSIVPAAGTTLTAGDRVTFTAVVDCTLVTSDGGVAGMVLQDQTTRSLLAPGEIQPQVTLVKGTTTHTFSHTVTIPESGSTVTALFPIFINDSNTTRAVVVRNYTVR
jgi:hypothetical protein